MTVPSGGMHMTSVLDLPYACVSGMELFLDLHLPAPVTIPHPLIIHIHGGAWEGGSKNPEPIAGLIREGYAAASITYRLSSVATFPAPLHDCKAAIRFLRSKAGEFRIDPARIGVWGESAGGHLAALLGVTGDEPEWEGTMYHPAHPEQSSAVQAVCDWFGPTDICHWDDMKPPGKKAADDGPIARMLGAPIRMVPDHARRASPIHHVSRERSIPPFLIMHGDADEIVPPQQSTAFTQALMAAGRSASCVISPGAGHGFPYTAAFMKPVIHFFDRHLRPSANIEADVPGALPAK